MTECIAGHPVPPRLAEGTDPGLIAWRARLPMLVEALLDRWDLRAEAPFLPGGSSAWVAPVRDAAGAERVLKVAWAHEESRDEAAGMAAWQGLGAARTHRHERRSETVALLLDRVRPGTPLAELLTWPERDEVVAQVARRLWKPPGELVGSEAAADFRPLSQMCAWWAGDAVLLATDLHPGNVLAASGGAWVLIDPKPYVGDPHYDVLQHMFNDPDRLRTRPGAFAERMAALAGLDPHRLRRWLFARCVQESGELDAAAEAALTLAAEGVE